MMDLLHGDLEMVQGTVLGMVQGIVREMVVVVTPGEIEGMTGVPIVGLEMIVT